MAPRDLPFLWREQEAYAWQPEGKFRCQQMSKEADRKADECEIAERKQSGKADTISDAYSAMKLNKTDLANLAAFLKLLEDKSDAVTRPDAPTNDAIVRAGSPDPLARSSTLLPRAMARAPGRTSVIAARCITVFSCQRRQAVSS